MLPLGGMLITIFAVWLLPKDMVNRQLGISSPASVLGLAYCRWRIGTVGGAGDIYIYCVAVECKACLVYDCTDAFVRCLMVPVNVAYGRGKRRCSATRSFCLRAT